MMQQHLLVAGLPDAAGTAQMQFAVTMVPWVGNQWDVPDVLCRGGICWLPVYCEQSQLAGFLFGESFCWRFSGCACRRFLAAGRRLVGTFGGRLFAGCFLFAGCGCDRFWRRCRFGSRLFGCGLVSGFGTGDGFLFGLCLVAAGTRRDGEAGQLSRRTGSGR